MSDQHPLKDYTVCAAFIDSDRRATATVKAGSVDDACARVIAMIDDGRLTTEVFPFDPGQTFVYGVVEGDGDPHTGQHLVPIEYQEPTVIHHGDAIEHLIAAAREVIETGRPITVSPAHSRALDTLAARLTPLADVPRR